MRLYRIVSWASRVPFVTRATCTPSGCLRGIYSGVLLRRTLALPEPIKLWQRLSEILAMFPPQISLLHLSPATPPSRALVGHIDQRSGHGVCFRRYGGGGVSDRVGFEGGFVFGDDERAGGDGAEVGDADCMVDAASGAECIGRAYRG